LRYPVNSDNARGYFVYTSDLEGRASYEGFHDQYRYFHMNNPIRLLYLDPIERIMTGRSGNANDLGGGMDLAESGLHNAYNELMGKN